MRKDASYLAAIVIGTAIFTVPVHGGVIYSSIPGPLPPNVPSLGYQATQTSEFGDLIQFAGTNRTLTQVTLVMSDWALASDYPSLTGPTWNHPITLNLYNVDNSGPNPAPGTLIATQMHTFAIPWRPPADPTCTDPTKYRASDGLCYPGLAFKITFDFPAITVPNQIIYGVAYNTQTWGYHPIGAPGPYVSLNFGLAQVPPSIGSNPFPDTAYWNTANASNYTDGGAGGVGIFRRDTAWTPYSGAVSFITMPDIQVKYVSNLDKGDSYINITNSGDSSTTLLAPSVPNPQVNIDGSICVNIYAFAADEQEVSCCSCLVTPNGLYSLSAKNALLNSLLTSSVPNELVVKLISSVPANTTDPTQACNPATVGATGGASGLLATGTTLHALPTTPVSYQLTETPFSLGTLSAAELQRDVQECQFIQVLGSGQFGICKGCQNSGLGAAAQ
jgi:hypothetical protein